MLGRVRDDADGWQGRPADVRSRREARRRGVCREHLLRGVEIAELVEDLGGRHLSRAPHEEGAGKRAHVPVEPRGDLTETLGLRPGRPCQGAVDGEAFQHEQGRSGASLQQELGGPESAGKVHRRAVGVALVPPSGTDQRRSGRAPRDQRQTECDGRQDDVIEKLWMSGEERHPERQAAERAPAGTLGRVRAHEAGEDRGEPRHRVDHRPVGDVPEHEAREHERDAAQTRGESSETELPREQVREAARHCVVQEMVILEDDVRDVLPALQQAQHQQIQRIE